MEDARIAQKVHLWKLRSSKWVKKCGRLTNMIASLGSDPRDLARDAAFQARVRHDLRSPINAMVGYLEMTLEDFETELAGSAARDIQTILRQCRQLAVAVDEVVDGASPSHPSGAEQEDAGIVAGLQRSVHALDSKGTAPRGRILVIDDEETNREILRRQLQLFNTFLSSSFFCILLFSPPSIFFFAFLFLYSIKLPIYFLLYNCFHFLLPFVFLLFLLSRAPHSPHSPVVGDTGWPLKAPSGTVPI